MRRGFWLGAAALAVAGLAAWLFVSPAGDGAGVASAPGGGVGMADAPAAASAAVASGAGALAAAGGPFSAAGLQQRQAQLALWQGRYERAEQTYASYRDATRYPHESRPITEHPDQVRPFDPVVETNALRRANGDRVDGVMLRTSQERVFLSGAETVKFTLSATDAQGRALPLIVTRASAQSVPDTRTPVPLLSTGVDFNDTGNGADSAAGDGVLSARLAPAQQGFGNYAGTIRLLAQVSINGEAGVAHFDVVYTPGVPATWGGVREAVEGGSLNFYLKAQVTRPGRYVVSGRVYDAAGNPFALLQFNEELAAGAREFRLQLFGALIRDRNPAFPLTLRDVEAFLLMPDTFPDRLMMPRQPGVVHTSASYAATRFSPDEWTSEERERYLAEYAKDAETARAQVQKLLAN